MLKNVITLLKFFKHEHNSNINNIIKFIIKLNDKALFAIIHFFGLTIKLQLGYSSDSDMKNKFIQFNDTKLKTIKINLFILNSKKLDIYFIT